jgi:diguanylate cyclase (GGDEF)-like protein
MSAALLEEHAALQEIAAMVARGAALEDLCARVAESAARLLDGEVALVLRFDESGRGHLVGRSMSAIANYPSPGEELKFAPASAIGTVLSQRRTARVAPRTPSPFQRDLGERIATPLELDGRLWGAMAVGVAGDRALGPDSEGRIERFAELVTLAIGNAEARAQLVARATTDPLTGLANHRAFHERLQDEVARALRYARPLSLVVIDVDRFKAINDTAGHQSGDAVLAEVARRIVSVTRTDSLVGRLGGDEFAVLLPECDGATALQVAERARLAVRSRAIGSHPCVTVSVGVGDLGCAATPQQLLVHARRRAVPGQGARPRRMRAVGGHARAGLTSAPAGAAISGRRHRTA